MSRSSRFEATRWINTLELRRHPEGGWFREIYRAPEIIARAALPRRFVGDRAFSTAIYFLLQAPDRSRFHRLRQDEVWHFYDGAPLTLHVIDHDGRYGTTTLGRDVGAGQTLVTVAPAGCLFGATVEAGTFALTGCTVAPGFDFDDLDIPPREALLARYPRHRAIVDRLSSLTGSDRG